MVNFTPSGSVRKRFFFLMLLVLVTVFTMGAACRYAVFLDGVPDTEINVVESGWFYDNKGTVVSLDCVPCDLEFSDNTLYLVHSISEMQPGSGEVLAIQTRYQSIRVWADEKMIYEAAQGQEYAFGSMWHFISANEYKDAGTLRVELTKYDNDTQWEIFSIFQDHPSTIIKYLLHTHMPALLVWLCCMLFTLLLAFVAIFMLLRKAAGLSLVLALASFIFLSGTWLLLDSKITSIFGGNYAITYFCSYSIFYLLPVPLLFYFQIILKLNNKILWYLIWITTGNAAFWMLMHLLGVVSIQDTATTVHLIIVLFLLVLIWESFRKKGQKHSRRLVCTFWGIFLIFFAAVISIVLYHTGLLPPTNSGVLYAWSLLALILCMMMDTVLIFDQVWKDRQYAEVYRQLATQDSMTKLLNRNAYELRLRELVAQPPSDVCIIMFDIDQVKYINDTYGHHVGDQVICFVARCIDMVFGEIGGCYRIGGDEFCVVTALSDAIPQKLSQFESLIQQHNPHSFVVKVSYGWEKERFEEKTTVTLKDIIRLKMAADRQLYQNKKTHRRG